MKSHEAGFKKLASVLFIVSLLFSTWTFTIPLGFALVLSFIVSRRG